MTIFGLIKISTLNLSNNILCLINFILRDLSSSCIFSSIFVSFLGKICFRRAFIILSLYEGLFLYAFFTTSDIFTFFIPFFVSSDILFLKLGSSIYLFKCDRLIFSLISGLLAAAFLLISFLDLDVCFLSFIELTPLF